MVGGPSALWHWGRFALRYLSSASARSLYSAEAWEAKSKPAAADFVALISPRY
jgi:hypothetical protein